MSLIIPEGVQTIGEDAFSDCINLCNVSFPKSLTEIGWAAFASCRKLESITIPGQVRIGPNAFCYCYNLISADFPRGLRKVDFGVFDGCSKLTDVSIKSIDKIRFDDSVFWGCKNFDGYIMTEDGKKHYKWKTKKPE